MSVIDIRSGATVDQIQFDTDPWGVAISPNGAFLYVRDDIGLVWVIDTSNNTVVEMVLVGPGPGRVAVSPDGSRVYATNVQSNSVSVLETSSNTVIETIKVPSFPWDIAITPDGRFAYVTIPPEDNAVVIETATNEVVASVVVGPDGSAVAIRSDGALAYLLSRPKISVIETSSNQVVATIPNIVNGPLGRQDVEISGDGNTLIATAGVFGIVYIIDALSNSVINSFRLPPFSDPKDVVFSPNGQLAYLQGSSTIFAMDPATGMIVDTLGSFIRGIGMVISPPPEIAAISVDIKPGSESNPINPKSRGVVPVAILGGADFDVKTVDVTSLRFGPARASPAHDLQHSPTHTRHLEDVNSDGHMDLIAHYRQMETGLATGDVEACVTAATVTGRPLRGCDAVRVF